MTQPIHLYCFGRPSLFVTATMRYPLADSMKLSSWRIIGRRRHVGETTREEDNADEPPEAGTERPGGRERRVAGDQRGFHHEAAAARHARRRHRRVHRHAEPPLAVRRRVRRQGAGGAVACALQLHQRACKRHAHVRVTVTHAVTRRSIEIEALITWEPRSRARSHGRAVVAGHEARHNDVRLDARRLRRRRARCDRARHGDDPDHEQEAFASHGC